MEGAVVLGVRTDIGLIEVDAVDAVQAVGVAELGIDRFVQIPVEFGAERVQLAAAGLALLEIQDEQVLQIVGVGVAAGCRARPSVQSNSGAFTKSSDAEEARPCVNV